MWLVSRASLLSVMLITLTRRCRKQRRQHMRAVLAWFTPVFTQLTSSYLGERFTHDTPHHCFGAALVDGHFLAAHFVNL